MNDLKGLSLVSVCTEKGRHVFNDIAIGFHRNELSWQQAIMSNPNLVVSQKKKQRRRNLSRMTLAEAVERTLKKSYLQKKIISFKYKFGILK